MTVWFTSDHHFDHGNIIKYANRPYQTREEMNADLIERWNEKVNPHDTVYHLGDFTLGGVKKARFFLSQLNGRIIVVPGGHDHQWVRFTIPHKDNPDSPSMYFSNNKPIEFAPPLFTLEYEDKIIVLCHYPMLSWDKSHYGSWHLHGHIHSVDGYAFPSADRQLPPKSKGGVNGLRLDVGVDAHNYYPISFDEVQEIMENERMKEND